MRSKNLINIKKLLYFLPFILIFFLGIVQIYLSNRLAVKGEKLKFLEDKINIITEENNRLESEIASLGCLNNLNLIAGENGFIKNPSILNLSAKIPVAINSR